MALNQRPIFWSKSPNFQLCHSISSKVAADGRHEAPPACNSCQSPAQSLHTCDYNMYGLVRAVNNYLGAKKIVVTYRESENSTARNGAKMACFCAVTFFRLCMA
eukprot:6210058-Pleurochrysis_carterae.AAC.1